MPEAIVEMTEVELLNVCFDKINESLMKENPGLKNQS
jgi:hypothetical protein